MTDVKHPILVVVRSAIVLIYCMAQFALAEETTFKAKVIGITDGDTIKVLQTTPCDSPHCDPVKIQHKVRLAEIDTPERRQPFGSRAKNMLSDLVFGQTVALRVIDKDRYGRLVAQVYVGDLWVNGEMVKMGGAWVYRKYASTPDIMDLEGEARAHKRGLWSLDESEKVPPWEWRKK